MIITFNLYLSKKKIILLRVEELKGSSMICFPPCFLTAEEILCYSATQSAKGHGSWNQSASKESKNEQALALDYSFWRMLTIVHSSIGGSASNPPKEWDGFFFSNKIIFGFLPSHPQKQHNGNHLTPIIALKF